MAKRTIEIGSRVAYGASFLRNTGQRTGNAGLRRGTLLSTDGNFARVRWDDFEETAPGLANRYGQDYVDDARKHGSLVLLANLAKVGANMGFCAC